MSVFSALPLPRLPFYQFTAAYDIRHLKVPVLSDQLNLAKMSSLTFEEADLARFPCLQLAFDAMAGGAALTNALNAANEVAVSSFLSGRIGFASIAQIVAKVLDDISASSSVQDFESVDDAIQCDLNARERALNYVVNSAR